jgi:hypothetical protein
MNAPSSTRRAVQERAPRPTASPSHAAGGRATSALAAGATDAGARPMSARRPGGALAVAAWAGLALTLAVPLWWGVDPRFSWDVDAIAPGSVLKAMAAHFGPTWFSSYGPAPYALTALAYAPLLVLYRLAGELSHPSALYPWGFAHPRASLGALVIAARLVTLALALASAWLAARAVRRLAPRAPGWVTPLLLAGSPVFAYYARSSNVDLHMLFWLFLAFEGAESDPPRPVLAGVAAAVALCCKEQIAPLALVALAAATFRAERRPGTDTRAAAVAALRVLGAAALTYAALWRLPWGHPGWSAHHRFLFEQAVYPRSYPPTPAGFAALARRGLQLTPLALGAATTVAVAGALARRVSWRGLGPRALLTLALPLAARGLEFPGAATARRGPPLRAAFALLAVVALAGGPALSWVMLDDPRLAAERWLRAHAPAGSVIEIGGNPHFQARVPEGHAVIVTRAEDLKIAARPPAGDLVLVSSIDAYRFSSDPAMRLAWWEPLHAPGAGGYRAVARFTASPLAVLVVGLPVAPQVEVFEAPPGARRSLGPRVARPGGLEPAADQDSGVNSPPGGR